MHEAPGKFALPLEIVDTAIHDSEKEKKEVVVSLLLAISVMDRRICIYLIAEKHFIMRCANYIMIWNIVHNFCFSLDRVEFESYEEIWIEFC